MSELASEVPQYGVVEEEPPELMGRNLRSGAHLMASATAFFFLAFVFAYFYLRSLNSGGMWRPKHVDPNLALGTIETVCIVAFAVLIRLGVVDHRAARRSQWRVKGALGLVAGLLAIAFQLAEWASQSFGPTDGGYASVFVGWTGFYLLFFVGTVYWLETIFATSYRYRNVQSGEPPAGHASGDPHRRAHDIADPLSLVRPGLEALSFYATFLAGIGVLAWILLYLA